MSKKHYKEKLSAFLNHELSADEKQEVGEHLLHCQKCRQEHDEIKFGAELAQKLSRADAPQRVWDNIETELNYEKLPQGFSFASTKTLAFTAVLFTAILGLVAILYLKPQENNNVAINDSKNSQIDTKTKNSSGWKVETIAGSPKIENASEETNLAIGGVVETDGKSRAKIDVADIGQVEIAPNSLVKLVNSSKTEHRLSLEKGTLEAQIFAPPRLFIVDTPSAVAVDLGCAYKLEVDEEGNSKLHVTSGYVALENKGFESIVPAGAICYTKRDKGLGTPYFETASEEFKKNLYKFDFENGGSKSLETILKLAKEKDTLTLWHLLSRVAQKKSQKGLK